MRICRIYSFLDVIRNDNAQYSFHTGSPVLMSLASTANAKFNPPKQKLAVELPLDLLPPVLVGSR
jgi:hypothetical protein